MQTSGSLMRPVASSFPLQVMLNLSIYFVPVWFGLTFSLLIYKGSVLPYSPTALGFEIVITMLMWFIQYWAVRLSKRGNLTEQTGILGIGIVLLLVNIGGIIFYLLGQTYVMRLDQGFCITFLVINVLCIVLAIVAMQGFGSVGPAPSSAMPNQMMQQQAMLQQGGGGGGAASSQQQMMMGGGAQQVGVDGQLEMKPHQD